MTTLKTIIKKILPLKSVFLFRNPLSFIKYFGNKCYCPVCDSNFSRFISIPEVTKSDLFLTDILVNGHRNSITNYETFNFQTFFCPICGAQDKVRMMAFFIKNFLNKSNNGQTKIKLLHFTPEAGLYDFLSKINNIEYYTSDLERTDVDFNFDLHNCTEIENNSFDLIICSHVLEHVENDKRCMSEIKRMLKQNGIALLMVPIMLTIDKDYENDAITIPEQRLLHFGQEDHVRLYSKFGFVQKLQEVGFKVNELSFDYFGKEFLKKAGLDSKNVLYVVEKI